MNTKKKIRQTVVFLVLTALMLGVLSKAMVSTNFYSTINVAGLYREPKESLDMVMIGASEVYSGYMPTQAYEEHGYTSYSMGSMALGANMYRTLVEEVWNRQHPQVIAIEVNGFLNGDNYLNNEGMIRNVTDNMPRNKNWVNTIQKVIDKKDRAGYYFPLLAYHDRWSDPKNMLGNCFIKAAMFFNGATNLKGFATFTHATPYAGQEDRADGGLEDQTRAYLIELLEYCKEQGIENVLFFRSPHVEKMVHQERLEEIGDIVKSYGYDWLNCDGLAEDVDLDAQYDFYNSGHMNINGAEKWTAYVGDYLTSHYDMNTQHSEKVESQWKQAVQTSNELYEQIRSDMANGIIRRYSEAAIYITPTIAKSPVEIGGDAHCPADCKGMNHICEKEKPETVITQEEIQPIDQSDYSE